MNTDQDKEENQQELSEILKAIQGAGVVVDGGLGRQCTVLLHEVLAKKVAKATGMALETIQLDTANAIGNWQAAQSASAAGEQIRAAGMVYIIKGDETGASDMTRFASAVSSMDPGQIDKSVLYYKPTDEPTLWAKEIRDLSMECGIAVLSSVDAIRSHYQ